MYDVYIERTAEKDLKRLPASDFYRIIAGVKALAENPRPIGSHKLSGSKADWRIRIGNYRVIYEIDQKAKAVKVMRVRHRREVYR